MNKNIIKLSQDIADKKTITLKKAAEILGMEYHTAYRRIKSPKCKIGYFDYAGKISVVEDDVKEYKRRAYVFPTQ